MKHRQENSSGGFLQEWERVQLETERAGTANVFCGVEPKTGRTFTVSKARKKFKYECPLSGVSED